MHQDLGSDPLTLVVILFYRGPEGLWKNIVSYAAFRQVYKTFI